MDIDLATIRTFLATNPSLGLVNDIMQELRVYEAKIKSLDKLWKKQLPFAQWGDLERREIFRDIFLQLQSQGVSIVYKQESSRDDAHVWRLKQGKTEGVLSWHRDKYQWEIYGFRLTETDGSSIPRFDFIVTK